MRDAKQQQNPGLDWFLFSFFSAGPNWFLPFFGNAPFLRKLAMQCGGQHNAFKKLTKDYETELLRLKLGRDLFMVGTGLKMVTEIQTREEFDRRPDNFFIRLRTMGTR